MHVNLLCVKIQKAEVGTHMFQLRRLEKPYFLCQTEKAEARISTWPSLGHHLCKKHCLVVSLKKLQKALVNDTPYIKYTNQLPSTLPTDCVYHWPNRLPI